MQCLFTSIHPILVHIFHFGLISPGQIHLCIMFVTVPWRGSRAPCTEASSSLPLPDVWHLHRLRERERLITLNPAMPLIIEQTVNKLMIFLTAIGEVAEG